jgi:peptide chain release factor 2
MLELEQITEDLKEIAEKLGRVEASMNIPELERELEGLRAQMDAPDFWSNVETAQRVSQRAKNTEYRIGEFRALKNRLENLEGLIEMCAEAEEKSLLGEIGAEQKTLAAETEKMYLSTLLSGRYDFNNAIISLHSGAGGTESQDWADMLYRMYTRYAEQSGYRIAVLDYLEGDGAGIKSVTFSVSGDYAYGYLKAEKGVHRLVRISPFDSAKRRHTSFASVEVMPEIEGDADIEIKPDDLKVDTFRSSGAGGQHVNKTESAIRITHIPSGIVVACQNERSQHQNREVAMRMLKARLIEIKEREHLDKIEDIKGVQKAIEWGSQIRSYVFMPYTLAKDHRTGFENGNINAVMDGDLDGFINAFLVMKAE